MSEFKDDTFSKVFDEFLIYASIRRKKQGFETLQHNLRLHVLPYFKNKHISDLRKKDIIDWQTIILSKNFSNSFNNSLYSGFSSFIQYCIVCEYIDENIVLSVPRFTKKNEKKEHNVYNIFEFRRFRRHLDSYIDKQFFNFIFFYGTRPSETMALKFSVLDKNKVHIIHNLQRRGKRELDTPKNQSSIRTIEINFLMRFRIHKLKKIYIKKYGTDINDFFIFGGIKPLSTTTLDRHKSTACKKAKIKEITQHEFRHSYATRMIRKGVPVDFVSRSMGHSNVSMTLNVYTHNEKRMQCIPFLNKFL